MTDALGNVTEYEYDLLGNQTVVTQPDPDGGGALVSPVTTMVYDAAGQLISVTDALGKTTTYAYDALSRQTSVTAPDGGVTSYTYDSVGRMLSLTDGTIRLWDSGSATIQ